MGAHARLLLTVPRGRRHLQVSIGAPLWHSRQPSSLSSSSYSFWISVQVFLTSLVMDPPFARNSCEEEGVREEGGDPERSVLVSEGGACY